MREFIDTTVRTTEEGSSSLSEKQGIQWMIADSSMELRQSRGAGMATQARWARFADGADEVHQGRIAQRTIDAYQRDGNTKVATGNLPL